MGLAKHQYHDDIVRNSSDFEDHNFAAEDFYADQERRRRIRVKITSTVHLNQDMLPGYPVCGVTVAGKNPWLTSSPALTTCSNCLHIYRQGMLEAE